LKIKELVTAAPPVILVLADAWGMDLAIVEEFNAFPHHLRIEAQLPTAAHLRLDRVSPWNFWFKFDICHNLPVSHLHLEEVSFLGLLRQLYFRMVDVVFFEGPIRELAAYFLGLVPVVLHQLLD